MIILTALIVILSAAVGYKSRSVSHAVLPFRDPILLTVVGLQIVAVIVDVAGLLPWTLIGNGSGGISETGQVIIACMTVFDTGYIAGYAMSSPGDVLYVDLPDETLSMSTVKPLVYYFHEDQLCIMPQTLGGIIASHLGARHTADMPIHEIARTRSVSIRTGLRRVGPVRVVPVSMYAVENATVGLFRTHYRKTRDEYGNIIGEVPRYLLHITVKHHIIRVATTVTDDPLRFWTKTGVYQEATAAAIAAKQQAARLEILTNSAAFDAGATLISGLVSLGSDTRDAQDEILRRVDEERQRRGESDGNPR